MSEQDRRGWRQRQGWRGRAGGRSWRERGSIGAFVAVLAAPIIGLIGLVYDGGLALEGRQRAMDLAEQAARAAGNDCDLGILRSQSDCQILDHTGARRIANDYMTNGVTLENFGVTEGNHTVVVQTRVKVNTVFLGLFGFNQFDIVLPPRRATAVTGLA
jgi:hypothetical protein